MSPHFTLPQRFCVECGHKISKGNKSGLCRSCAKEDVSYLPTPAQIAEECRKIQVEWGIERWQNGAPDS